MSEASTIQAVLFYCFAAMMLAGAFGVLLSRNIVRTAMWLLSTLISAAGLYFLLGASFVGAIQLTIYAGGTLVLIVFGVMLTSKDPTARFAATRLEIAAGGIVCCVLAAVLVAVFFATPWHRGPVAAGDEQTMRAQADRLTDLDAAGQDGTANIGRGFLGDYLVPFEVVSLLLLTALIGAAYLARPRVPTTRAPTVEQAQSNSPDEAHGRPPVGVPEPGDGP